MAVIIRDIDIAKSTPLRTVCGWIVGLIVGGILAVTLLFTEGEVAEFLGRVL